MTREDQAVDLIATNKDSTVAIAWTPTPAPDWRQVGHVFRHPEGGLLVVDLFAIHTDTSVWPVHRVLGKLQDDAPGDDRKPRWRCGGRMRDDRRGEILKIGG